MKKIILILLCLVSFSALAELPQTVIRYTAFGDTVLGQYASQTAACQASMGPAGAAYGRTYTRADWQPPYCYFYYMYNGIESSAESTTIRGDQMPWCVSTDTAPVNGQCVPPPPKCTAGRIFETTISQGTIIPGTSTTTDMSYPTNVGGCQVVDPVLLNCMSTVSGAVFCKFRLRETGVQGTGTATPTATLPPDATTPEAPTRGPTEPGGSCPAGTVNIGTDSSGVPMCKGGGTAPSTPAPPPTTTKPPVTTTNPDGTTTKTETTIRENRDGSTTTTTRTTTTNPDGSTRITEGETTGPATNGLTGKPDPTTEQSKEFCKQNPNLNICKNSTVSGDCASVSCEGDAITCAMLRQQKKEYCENTVDTPQSTLGQQILTGSDPAASTFPSKSTAQIVQLPTTLNQTGFLGSGECFKDFVFKVSGLSFTLPISKICDYLIALRGLVMLLAGLASWRLLSKSVMG